MTSNPLLDEISTVRVIRPFHTVAYIISLEKGQAKYLLMKRCGEYLTGNWQMVSGGIEEGETAWQAALREIKEETNLVPDRFYSADIVESFYEFSWDSIVMAPVFVAFIDTLQTVQLSSTEHDDYHWLPYSEACDLLEFSNQQRIIQHIQENFINKIPNERFRIHATQFLPLNAS